MILWEQDVAWLLITSYEAERPLEFVIVALWSTWNESSIVATSFVEKYTAHSWKGDRLESYHKWVEGHCDMSYDIRRSEWPNLKLCL